MGISQSYSFEQELGARTRWKGYREVLWFPEIEAREPMKNTGKTEKKASAPNHPDAEHVGEHLVIKESEWVPGQHPDPNRGHPEQASYLDRFHRCTLCGTEVMRKRDSPDLCDNGGDE